MRHALNQKCHSPAESQGPPNPNHPPSPLQIPMGFFGLMLIKADESAMCAINRHLPKDYLLC
jgi:hypothetical protein